jgi:hypothetical protein
MPRTKGAVNQDDLVLSGVSQRKLNAVEVRQPEPTPVEELHYTFTPLLFAGANSAAIRRATMPAPEPKRGKRAGPAPRPRTV